jgi:hypothetical protein
MAHCAVSEVSPQDEFQLAEWKLLKVPVHAGAVSAAATSAEPSEMKTTSKATTAPHREDRILLSWIQARNCRDPPKPLRDSHT